MILIYLIKEDKLIIISVVNKINIYCFEVFKLCLMLHRCLVVKKSWSHKILCPHVYFIKYNPNAFILNIHHKHSWIAQVITNFLNPPL